MKILSLNFKNLNSLYGQWTIDFSNPNYLDNGLFAITGPTGAGKSMILDAICLALYGQTPRLKVISESVNEVMSRQSGECFAEIEFQTGNGVYRCHWSQRKARGKVDGKLQSPKHEVSDVIKGKVLESKIKKVKELVAQKTGMDFKRFCESILLAQGGFTAFLKASSDERSEILEQMTGSEIYSEISKMVYERYTNEESKKKGLQKELEGIQTLTEDQLKDHHDNLMANTSLIERLNQSEKKLGQSISWLKDVQRLDEECLVLEEKHLQLQQQQVEFKPKEQKLASLQKAKEITPSYIAHEAVKQGVIKIEKQIDVLQLQLPKLQKNADDSQKQYGQTKATWQQSKALQTAQAPLIKKARVFDHEIKNYQSQIEKSDTQLKKLIKQLSAQTQEENRITQNINQLEQNNHNNLLYIKQYAMDETLELDFQGVVLQTQFIKDKQNELDNYTTELDKAQKLLAKEQAGQQQCQKSLNNGNVELNKAKQCLVKRQSQLKTLLAGQTPVYYIETLELKLKIRDQQKLIINLEKERQKLIDREACPLCGSRDHPYADTLPLLDSDDEVNRLKGHIKKIANANNKVIEQEKVIAQSQRNYDALYTSLSLANEKVKNAKGESQKLKDTLLIAQQALFQAMQTLNEQVHKYTTSITTVKQVSQLDQLQSQLQQRLDDWWKTQVALQEYEQQKQKLNEEINLIKQSSLDVKQHLSQAQAEFDALVKEKNNLLKQREELFADIDPDIYEAQLQQAIEHAQKKHSAIDDKLRLTNDKLLMLRTKLETYQGDKTQKDKTYVSAKKDFYAQLQSYNIVNEEAFELLYQQQDQIAELQKKKEQLQSDLGYTNTQLKDNKTQQAKLKASPLTDESMENHLMQQQFLQSEKQQAHESHGSLNRQLQEHKNAQRHAKDKIVAIEQQNLQVQMWANLRALIGSQDGKKYRNFAQGLTFELMVNHANQQLQQVSDRCLLIRDQKEPLQLNVIDNYQAGEVRTTKNLSGGESFIASLSLALGLSKMASQKVRVGSLFLDEGFGTLDEEALETALEVLLHLQKDGKLIGVISHVPALKERISSQIKVTPISGGKSILEGAGCQRA